MTSNLLKKMQKTGYKKVTERSGDLTSAANKIFGTMIPTNVPAFNVAISGRMDGGVGGGIVTIAGKSKHFKTLFCLLAASAFLKEHEDGLILFYDSEGGANLSYFEMMGIDVNRVLHIPIENLEELSFDLNQKLKELTEEDKVFIMLDSAGNLASVKELNDALDEKSVADMTRAKSFKGFYRMITPVIKRLGIPFYQVQHTYDTMENYSKEILAGGQGGMLSSDTVLIVGKRQVKSSDKELLGHEFILKAEKSRFIKEKSAIPVTVLFDGGLYKYSSIFEWAIELGYIGVPNQGWYTRSGVEGDKKWRKKEIEANADEFYEPIMTNPQFFKEVEAMYSLGSKRELNVEMIDDLDDKLSDLDDID